MPADTACIGMIQMVIPYAIILVSISICKSRIITFKVAEHSFQVPMPNTPLLLFMLWRPFFARAKFNHGSIYCRILARVYAVAMATGLVKTRLKK